jgi:hypothetical protein
MEAMNMATKKVRTGTNYIYYPVLMDRIHDLGHGVMPGSIVKVIQPYGCPKNGTMGQCYIGTADEGKFLGMVCCNSLYPMSDAKLVADAIRADIAKKEARS